MRPELEALAADYGSALERLRALRRAVPPEAWSRRPAPESWSPAECVAHLNLTSQAYVPILHDGLAEARRLGGGAPARLSRDVFGWLIAWVSGPNRRFKTRTRPSFVPSGNRPVDELIAEFERLQADHLACLREADGLPIDRVKVSSPFEARLRYSLYSALTLIPGHQHRHLLQAELAAGLPSR